MIRQGEIQKIAATLGLSDTQIEKDYILGWVLNGISNQKELQTDFAFKGGTSLRKIYYPDYRLSEDLDFTFIGSNFDINKIKDCFEKLIIWIYEESRITLTILDETEHETGNYNFFLGYVGPLGGTKNKIKIDISSDEVICEKPKLKPVINKYSDSEEFHLFTYSLNEIIAEKMRSLMQRTEPRDLYDIWYLFEVEGEDIENIVFDFEIKAKHKNKDPNSLVKTVEGKEATFKKQWETRLVNQILDLPKFDNVWRELGKHWRKFNKSFNK